MDIDSERDVLVTLSRKHEHITPILSESLLASSFWVENLRGIGNRVRTWLPDCDVLCSKIWELLLFTRSCFKFHTLSASKKAKWNSQGPEWVLAKVLLHWSIIWFGRCAVWDGQMVLAGGESGYLQIWDLINVQEVCRITAHEGKTLHKPGAMNSDKKKGWQKNEGKGSAGGQKFVYFLIPSSSPFFRFPRFIPISRKRLPVYRPYQPIKGFPWHESIN